MNNKILSQNKKKEVKDFMKLLFMPEEQLIRITNKKVSEKRASIFGEVLELRFPSQYKLEVACRKYLN